jgi:hypothetical protein
MLTSIAIDTIMEGHTGRDEIDEHRPRGTGLHGGGGCAVCCAYVDVVKRHDIVSVRQPENSPCSISFNVLFEQMRRPE